MGTDGASVYTGKWNGVVVKLRESIPWLTGIHCVAHNIELAADDSIKRGMNAILDVKNTLEGVYRYYRDSQGANRQIREVAEMLNEEFNRPTTVFGTRWSAHYHCALLHFLASFSVIHAHLQNEAATSSGSSSMQGRARNTIQHMENFFSVGYMHLLLDVFAILTRISLQFQRNNITLSAVKDALETACLRYLAMVARPGENLASFLEEVGEGNTFRGVMLRRQPAMDQRLNTVKEQLCNNMVEQVNHRFISFEEVEHLAAADILDLRLFPRQLVGHPHLHEVAGYGNVKLDVLVTFYREPLEARHCDVREIQRESQQVKVLMNRHNGMTSEAFWQMALIQHQEAIENLAMLVEIILILPMCTACCKRGFSAVKRIKSDWRNCLNVSVLDDLLRISLEGPSVEDYEPGPAIQHWWEAGERARRPRFNPAGPAADRN